MPSFIHKPLKALHTPLIKPSSVKQALPLDEISERSVDASRHIIRGLLDQQTHDDRLVVIVGPCSIHDTVAALEYASLLAQAADRHRDELFIVMRVYVEKPRSTVGWKGLLHHPDHAQDFGESHYDTLPDLNKGVSASRQIMLDVASKGLPVATELLNPLLVHYFEDIVSVGVIGARTTESQTHREMASCMPMPMGIKNGTDGGLKVAIDAMTASSRPHTVVGVDEDASLAYRISPGNPNTFMILRGGSKGPNYSAEHIQETQKELLRAGQKPNVVVDCSHGNSNKDYRNQTKVAACLAEQIAAGASITGVMIESNINEGRQDVSGKETLKYGVSITDGCVGWNETEMILNGLAVAVKQRRGCSAESSASVSSASSIMGEPSQVTHFENSLITEQLSVQ